MGVVNIPLAHAVPRDRLPVCLCGSQGADQLSMVSHPRTLPGTLAARVRATARANTRMTILAQETALRVSLVPLSLTRKIKSSASPDQGAQRLCVGALRAKGRQRWGAGFTGPPGSSVVVGGLAGDVSTPPPGGTEGGPPKRPTDGHLVAGHRTTCSMVILKAAMHSRANRGAMMHPVEAEPSPRALSPWM